MILGCKKYFPDGTLTDFVIKILAGQKIHSIREDKHKRWKAGMKIHFATGVRTKEYNCFLIGRCQSVQEISIYFYRCNENDLIVINREKLSQKEKEILARNDGFETYKEFRNWFIKMYGMTFRGRIIHWTPFRYHKKGGFTYDKLPIVLDLPGEIENVAKMPQHLQEE